MSYTALYRKWRPAEFEDVKGQDHIVNTLKNQIKSGRIGHAYLFCGTRGTGKTTIAKIFAKAVNCEHPIDGSPCNECDLCKNISKGASLNVVEIDAASNNGVENIREIREQVQYPPTEGKYRVYIIDEVHMLSTGAFNALLKTLEEPPSYVIFILATTEVHKIPITVLSRCQRYDFKRISIETLTGRLKEMTAAEKIEVEDKALAYIAKAGDGSMRDSISLLDQCVAFHFGEKLTYDNVLDVLGAVDHEIFGKMFRAVAAGKTIDCIKILEEIVIQGRELGQFITDFIWYMRNLLLIKTTPDAENLLDMSTENIKILSEDAKLVDEETLTRYLRVMSELSNRIRYASQKRVDIEVAFIKLTRPQMENNLDSILQRLSLIEEQLEDGIPMQSSSMIQMPAPVDTGSGENSREPEKITLPKAQLEDLNLIKNEWAKIIKALGGVIRASFRDTFLEPAGEGCLCIVFTNQDNYEIGRRPTVLSDIEDYVKTAYQKELYFKARLKDSTERLDTIYVTEEELQNHINIDIEIEDEN